MSTKDGKDATEHGSSPAADEAEKAALIEKPFALPLPPFSFWRDWTCAVLMGCILGLFSVAYIKAITLIPKYWYTADGNSAYPADPNTLWFVAGKPWWIAVGAGTGIVEGLIKAVTNMDEYPSFVIELRERVVHYWVSARVVALCLLSNFGGASMGPEAGLGSAGAILGQLTAVAVSRFSAEVDHKLYTALGMCAALAAFLPDPFVSLLLCVEVGRPLDPIYWNGASPLHVLTLMATTASASYAVYFAINTKPYLEITALVIGAIGSRRINSYDFAIGILFGLGGAILALCYSLIGGVIKAVFTRIGAVLDLRIGRRFRIFIHCAVGGTLFGVFNYVFPMTVGDGSIMLGPIIQNGALHNISSGLLVASLFMKFVSYWICAASGLVGGIFFPLIFAGTAFGQVMALWTGVDDILAVSCGMTAVAAAFVPAPYTLIVLPFLSLLPGQRGMFPIFTTVFTAYLCFVGVGVPQTLMALLQKKKGKAEAAPAELADVTD